jgi:uncharacterized membrane protein YeaQ/YmgE (transglycosylase-associated protein family)
MNFFGVFVPSSWIYWGLIGLMAGWITGKLTRGAGFGCIADVFIGLVGAFIGGWIFTRMGIHFGGFFGSLAAATVGAVLLVSVARLLSGHE